MSVFDKIHTGVLSCLETRITQNPKWLKFKKPNIQVTIKLRGAGIQEAENSNRNTLFLCCGDQMTIFILFYLLLSPGRIHFTQCCQVSNELWRIQKKKLLDPKMQHVKISGFKYNMYIYIFIHWLDKNICCSYMDVQFGVSSYDRLEQKYTLVTSLVTPC